ncbi:MAG: DUF1343 domain-containing protein [Gemmatimonadetes bacterium]|jgi:uncharacterized protein YbbC (DUF1343 family)|nr:DUF1343 domain-containing protein [Gemmatimonadota bacterium]
MSRFAVRTGLDRLISGEAGAHLKDAAAGLILHPASVTAGLDAAADALLGAGFRLRSLFGPQHGARGEKQDNMVESAYYADPGTGLPVHSLYSDVRQPTAEMLTGIETLLFDLQDVGVRVYTFVWTMALAMEACARAGLRFVVLDRPNPVGGTVLEGPVLRAGFESFVGLHPVPLRHGLTVGELARWLNVERGIGCDLDVVPMEGWRRDMSWSETGLPWVLPSPNLPTPASCAVYPGMVLVEGTNLSEGRGTTKPFELVGAPWIDGRALALRMRAEELPGVSFRACSFEPTFQKHAGHRCGGVQIHVTDAAAFRPVRTAIALLRAARDLAPADFAWRMPPYEYEERLMPIDILWGHDGLRRGLDAEASVDEILGGVDRECATFAASTEAYRLYA